MGVLSSATVSRSSSASRAAEAPPAPELGPWLSQLPEVPGVRALERMPASAMLPRVRASYRRQAAPGAGSSTAPQQEIFSLVREALVLRETGEPLKTPTVPLLSRTCRTAAMA